MLDILAPNNYMLSVLFLVAAWSPQAVAQVSSGFIEPHNISSEDVLPAPRWMFGVGKAPTGDSVAANMAEARQAQMSGDMQICLKKAERAFARAKNLQPWIALTELECATKQQISVRNNEELMKITALVEKNQTWFLRGAATPLLKVSLVNALLVSLDQDFKTNRIRAGKTLERLQDLQAFADDKQRAKIWLQSGELALLLQKPLAAKELILRSLEIQDSEESRSRLSTVQKVLGEIDDEYEKEAEAEKSTAKGANQNLETSKDELELVDRVSAALKAGDLISMTADAVKLIHDFPGGTRAKWATERIAEAYWSLADKTDLKSNLTHQAILKKMLLIDCDRQADLAKTMYARGQWDDALTLSQKALDGETGARSTTVLDTAAKSALATDHFEIAIKLFERLVQQSSGQPAAREALLHLGLLHYRHGEYAVASAEFERLLTFSQINNFELIARYWQWRSLQKLNSNQADLVADGLMHKAPFSYYGLRARIDRSGGVLEWKEPTAKLTVKEWLTESEKATWDRVQSLLKAGWLDEAQAEIKLLPRPEKVEEKALRALLWAASGQYVNAAKLANEAWDENPELRRSPFVNAVFPLEFSNAIATQAKNRNLDSYMLKGLIKQESGYNVKAISSSNAYGLMQIIPPTAREIAQDLHLGTLQLPDDMFEPTRNILMGTYYIGKLLNKYQGQVPLALAAYNAGPARMDRWIKSRPTLKDLSASRSSQADAELWIDEIPYWETSNYVKSILRNILIYRMLDQGRVEVTEPMWLSSTAR